MISFITSRSRPHLDNHNMSRSCRRSQDARLLRSQETVDNPRPYPSLDRILQASKPTGDQGEQQIEYIAENGLEGVADEDAQIKADNPKPELNGHRCQARSTRA